MLLKTTAPVQQELSFYLLWSRAQESNPQPADYKSAALPIELARHND